MALTTTNQVLEFAENALEADGAILALEDYEADSQRLGGHQPGLARMELENMVLRQVSRFSRGVAQFIAEHYVPGVVDDGDVAKIVTGMEAAINALISDALPEIGAATTEAAGIARIGTQEEVLAGILGDVIVSPVDLAAALVRQHLHGQCVMAKSGANIVLLPRNGNKIIINGVVCTVPAAGVSLAPTGLTPDALYYVYAYMSGGSMALEASATGHSTDATTGVEIKTGAATHTLVGMVRPITGPAFADTAAQRFVRSWFNRVGLKARQSLQALRSTTSLSPVETNTADRCAWLSWADERLCILGQANGYNSGAGYQTSMGIYVDGASVGLDTGFGAPVANYVESISTLPTVASLAEGYHYASMMFYVTAGTGSLNTNSGMVVWG